MVNNIFMSLILSVFLLFANCAHAVDYNIRFDEETELSKDTFFSGIVYIKDSVTVPKDITLTIKPGTVIMFENPGICDDGNVNYSIAVEGSLVAIGTKEEPILFTSASKEKISSFGEIFINESGVSTLEYCAFQYSHWALHVHDSNVKITRCIFQDSYGGIRFKGDAFIQDNIFINNDTALRFWMGSPIIDANLFENVGTALFIREKVTKKTVIKGNRFKKVKDYYIKLGEMQDSDINIYGNDFDSFDTIKNMDDIRKKIFDRKNEDYIGRVNIFPFD